MFRLVYSSMIGQIIAKIVTTIRLYTNAASFKEGLDLLIFKRRVNVPLSSLYVYFTLQLQNIKL